MATYEAKTVWLKDFLNEGIPGPEHFEIKGSEVQENDVQEGQILVQAHCFSVDPYLRAQLKSSHPMAKESSGKRPMSGFISGKVLVSKNKNFAQGDLVGGSLQFSTFQIVPEETAAGTWKLNGIVDEEHISRGVGVFGMPGSTAYAAIDVMDIKEKETVFVSAASGAVGSLVGQICKNEFQCTTIGSAGGPEKCELIKAKFGYDFAINYKEFGTKDDLVAALKKCAPEGIDAYMDNVGGIHFDAAFEVLRAKGRIAVCGGISQYNSKSSDPRQIDPLRMVYTQQRIEGFVCMDWLRGKKGTFLESMSKWVNEGKINVEETFFDGVEKWPLAFQSLFGEHSKDNKGKVVVRVL